MRPAIPGIPEASWFKSSYSGAGATECVETALIRDGVAVRDSKEPGRGLVTFTADAWQAFAGDIRAGAEET
ncbi:DUF397 domain-containing protein [Streptomyces carminius]|uniref:DUF397 domain-containing protein n=1 Tax=Streptomyces carminius TaxID=2665496 RepID=A0A2M8M4Q5_9ACTN|nr:DUF397 domain-containing protein [Streptomyces carminius]PJE99180.1 DUF397 domain-containing protein [Streptomyces carminius]